MQKRLGVVGIIVESPAAATEITALSRESHPAPQGSITEA